MDVHRRLYNAVLGELVSVTLRCRAWLDGNAEDQRHDEHAYVYESLLHVVMLPGFSDFRRWQLSKSKGCWRKRLQQQQAQMQKLLWKQEETIDALYHALLATYYRPPNRTYAGEGYVEAHRDFWSHIQS